MNDQPTRVSVTLPTSEWDEVVAELLGLEVIVKREIAALMVNTTDLAATESLVHKLRLVSTTRARLEDKLDGASDLEFELGGLELAFSKEVDDLEAKLRAANDRIKELEAMKDKRTSAKQRQNFSKRKNLNLGA